MNMMKVQGSQSISLTINVSITVFVNFYENECEKFVNMKNFIYKNSKQ